MATLTTPKTRSGQNSNSNCTPEVKPVRRDRIARAKARLKSGYYDRHEALLDLVAMRMLSDLQQEE